MISFKYGWMIIFNSLSIEIFKCKSFSIVIKIVFIWSKIKEDGYLLIFQGKDVNQWKND